MSVASRQSKPRKESNAPQSNNQRRPAWRNNNSPFNQNHNSGPGSTHRSNNANAGHNNAGNFPPLSQSGAQERAALLLSNHTGTTVMITTRNNSRFEGTLHPPEQEGTGVILKDCKDLNNPSNGIKPSHFVAAQYIVSWQAVEVPSANASKANGDWDSFRTDMEISGQGNVRRDRDLQAWKPDANVPNPATSGFNDPKGDDATFGPSASKGSWDQFAENERLFGITTNYDEDLYTTKLDRTAADFKERERRAQQIANEIMGTSTSNPHIAEERNIVDDSGVNEEDKYGAVVRGPNAYIPPGARKGMNGSALPAKSPPQQPAAPAATAQSDVPKLAVQGPDGTAKASPSASPSLPNAGTNATPATGPASNGKPAVAAGDNSLVGSFRDFVTHERQRLAQKKQAIVKSEMDKRMQDLIKFSQSFKLNRPIPEDLVPILTKDEVKQKAIVRKSAADAESTGARAIGVPQPAPATGPKPNAPTPQLKEAPAVRKPVPSNSNSTTSVAAAAKPAAAKPGAKPFSGMFIQAIPPFNPEKRRAALAASVSAPGVAADSGKDSHASSVAPASPTNSVTSSTSAAFKLNANASSFKPSPTAPPFKPVASPSSPGLKPSSSTNSAVASPKVFSSPIPKPSENPPPTNPFFGAKVIKKTGVVHIKDDFNPFKFAKVAEASAVSAIWQYNGKRYQYMFSMIPHNTAPPPPPPTYEEDTAAQAARTGGYGMMYAYPAPYQYPGQPPQQPMMAVPAAAPGGYVPPHFMQPMQYPAPPPGAPPTMYAPPQMASMPPGQGYLPPAPYPPQNGAPRGSMPPAPMPPHAYYHQSPQMAHAVPYPMMMQPPAAAAPYPYDTQQGPPGSGPMGVGH